MLEMPMMTISPPKNLMMETDGSSDSITSSDLSGGTRGSSSPSLKRPRLDDLKPRSSISKESDELFQSDDPHQAPYAEVVDASEPFIDDETYASFLACAFTSSDDEVVDNSNQAQNYAELALAHYKEKKGKDYEYTGRRSMCPLPSETGLYGGNCVGTHLNFFARPRGSHSEPESLFYAKLHYSSPHNEVIDCYVFPFATNYGIDLIIHPPDAKCPGCPTFVGVDPSCWDIDD